MTDPKYSAETITYQHVMRKSEFDANKDLSELFLPDYVTYVSSPQTQNLTKTIISDQQKLLKGAVERSKQITKWSADVATLKLDSYIESVHKQINEVLQNNPKLKLKVKVDLGDGLRKTIKCEQEKVLTNLVSETQKKLIQHKAKEYAKIVAALNQEEKLCYTTQHRTECLKEVAKFMLARSKRDVHKYVNFKVDAKTNKGKPVIAGLGFDINQLPENDGAFSKVKMPECKSTKGITGNLDLKAIKGEAGEVLCLVEKKLQTVHQDFAVLSAKVASLISERKEVMYKVFKESVEAQKDYFTNYIVDTLQAQRSKFNDPAFTPDELTDLKFQSNSHQDLLVKTALQRAQEFVALSKASRGTEPKDEDKLLLAVESAQSEALSKQSEYKVELDEIMQQFSTELKLRMEQSTIDTLLGKGTHQKYLHA